jgi:hypothetical protein
MIWDDLAGAVTWLMVGSGLSITDTTITATGGGSGAYDLCRVQQHLAKRELLKKPLAHRVELYHRGDVFGRWIHVSSATLS